MADPIEHREVAIADLIPYGENPREGDVGLIASSLERLGQYRTIVVNSNPDADTYMNIAADNLHRRGYMIELDPGYCDVIRDRWRSLHPDNTADLMEG